MTWPYELPPHLAAQLAPKDAAHKGGGRKVWVGLGLERLEAGLVHGVQQAAQELMRVLLAAQAEPADAATTGQLAVAGTACIWAAFAGCRSALQQAVQEVSDSSTPSGSWEGVHME